MEIAQISKINNPPSVEFNSIKGKLFDVSSWFLLSCLFNFSVILQFNDVQLAMSYSRGFVSDLLSVLVSTKALLLLLLLHSLNLTHDNNSRNSISITFAWKNALSIMKSVEIAKETLLMPPSKHIWHKRVMIAIKPDTKFSVNRMKRRKS